MPFETKFQKEDIVDAAFKLAEKEGFKAITARSVAKRINGSVAPIYFNFKNIDELVDAVVQKVFKISQEIFLNQKSTSLYENMGRAGFEFAEKYPVFFRELVLNPNPYIGNYETTEIAMLHGLDQDEVASKLTIEERKKFIFKVKALQIGFQTMIANQHLPSYITKSEVQELFIQLGNQLIQLEISSRRK